MPCTVYAPNPNNEPQNELDEEQILAKLCTQEALTKEDLTAWGLVNIISRKTRGDVEEELAPLTYNDERAIIRHLIMENRLTLALLQQKEFRIHPDLMKSLNLTKIQKNMLQEMELISDKNKDEEIAKIGAIKTLLRKQALGGPLNDKEDRDPDDSNPLN